MQTYLRLVTVVAVVTPDRNLAGCMMAGPLAMDR